MKKNILMYNFIKKNIIYIFVVLFLFFYYLSYLVLLIDFKDYVEHAFILMLLFIIFPILFSLIIYKNITLYGYFFGFIIQWILYLNVNPYPLSNDNKLIIMNLIPEKYRPEKQFLLQEINNNYFEYPIIIKPILCSGGSLDITIINSEKELIKYLKNKKNIKDYMVQNYLYNDNIEIGVLWEKFPWEKEGKVIEIFEKTNIDKIRSFNLEKSKNHNYLINNEINKLFNNISENIPNMNVCRYDIRLQNMDHLERGKFKIVEVNGTMGMHFNGYFTYNINKIHKINIMIDIKWYLKRLLIGFYNILSLQGYSPLSLLFVMYKSYFSALKCYDWENIYSLYS